MDVSAAPDLQCPVLIVGPPRSGTTLLRHTLNRHPDLAVTPETHLLDVWAARFPQAMDGRDFARFWDAFTTGPDFARSELDATQVRAAMTDPPDVRAAYLAVMMCWAAQRGARRIGEKTPGHARHLTTLLDWFPRACVVWLRRDPRDTTASQLAFDQAWAADEAAVPALQWARTERAWERWQGDPRVLTVRYEDLVTDAEGVIGGVLAHLDLPRVPEVLHGPEPRTGTWHGGIDPAAAPVPSSVGRWQDRLTPAQVGVVDAITRRGRRIAGYPAAAAHFDGAWRVAYRGGLLGGALAPAKDGLRRIVRYARGRPGARP